MPPRRFSNVYKDIYDVGVAGNSRKGQRVIHYLAISLEENFDQLLIRFMGHFENNTVPDILNIETQPENRERTNLRIAKAVAMGFQKIHLQITGNLQNEYKEFLSPQQAKPSEEVADVAAALGEQTEEIAAALPGEEQVPRPSDDEDDAPINFGPFLGRHSWAHLKLKGETNVEEGYLVFDPIELARYNHPEVDFPSSRTLEHYRSMAIRIRPPDGTDQVHAPAEQSVPPPIEQSVPILPEESVLAPVEQSVPTLPEQSVSAFAEQSVPTLPEQSIPAPAEQPVPAPAEQLVPPLPEQPVPAPAEQLVPPLPEQPVPAPAEQLVPPLPEQPVPALPEQPVPAPAEQPVPPLPEQPVPAPAEQPVPPLPEQQVPAPAEQLVPPLPEQPVPPLPEQPVPAPAEQSVPPAEAPPGPTPFQIALQRAIDGIELVPPRFLLDEGHIPEDLRAKYLDIARRLREQLPLGDGPPTPAPVDLPRPQVQVPEEELAEEEPTRERRLKPITLSKEADELALTQVPKFVRSTNLENILMPITPLRPEEEPLQDSIRPRRRVRLAQLFRPQEIDDILDAYDVDRDFVFTRNHPVNIQALKEQRRHHISIQSPVRSQPPISFDVGEAFDAAARVLGMPEDSGPQVALEATVIEPDIPPQLLTIDDDILETLRSITADLTKVSIPSQVDESILPHTLPLQLPSILATLPEEPPADEHVQPAPDPQPQRDPQQPEPDLQPEPDRQPEPDPQPQPGRRQPEPDPQPQPDRQPEPDPQPQPGRRQPEPDPQPQPDRQPEPDPQPQPGPQANLDEDRTILVERILGMLKVLWEKYGEPVTFDHLCKSSIRACPRNRRAIRHNVFLAIGEMHNNDLVVCQQEDFTSPLYIYRGTSPLSQFDSPPDSETRQHSLSPRSE